MECLSCTHRNVDEPAINQWNRIWDVHMNGQTKTMTNNNAQTATPDFLPFDSNIGDESNRADQGRDSVNRFPHYRSPVGAIHAENPPQIDPRFTPWKRREKRYSIGVIGLHEEIHDFYNYIKSAEAEDCMREEVILRVSEVINSLWPQSKVKVFGSTKTHLNLPTSDIDMVAFGNWSTPPLHTLETELLNKGICSAEEVKVLDKASVPIIKFTDDKTKVKVDICFNMVNGLQSADLIEKYLQDYPNLKYLVMVLKQFLSQRDLNEVFNGGLSSYALILLVVSFFQNHERADSNSDVANVGVLLIEFLELYGKRFNYLRTGIVVTGEGRYVDKTSMKMDNGALPSGLCIEDPLKPGNDIGRSSYQILTIREAFSRAYMLLVSYVLPQNVALFDRKESILGTVIEISLDVQDYRNAVHKEFSKRDVTPVTTVSVASLVSSTSSPQTSKRSRNSPVLAQQENNTDASSEASSRNLSDSDGESSGEGVTSYTQVQNQVPNNRIAVSVQTTNTKHMSSSDDPSSGTEEHFAPSRQRARGATFSRGRSSNPQQTVRQQGPKLARGASSNVPGKRRKSLNPPHNRH